MLEAHGYRRRGWLGRAFVAAVAAIMLAGAGQAAAYLQCVPYARQVSGIQIYGDAHSWWSQAAGRYARGQRPVPGAVLAFRPHGNMRLGHVAAVSRIVDARTILIRHANWSPIGGVRGQIEDDVRVIDVSAANDWSEVRVWFAPLGDLGTTRWPTHGFIYPDHAPRIDPGPLRMASSRGIAPAPSRRSLLDAGFARAIERAATAETRPPARLAAAEAPRLSYDMGATRTSLSW
mgnify:CR=1 FL=1